MKVIEDSTLAYCWKILDKVEVGKSILVSDHAKKDPQLFIDCAKKYYDTYGSISFSDDFLKIRKTGTFKEIENLFG